MILFFSPQAKAQELNELIAVRKGISPHKIRLVLDLRQRPLYQAYFLHDPERLIVDIFEARCDDGLLKDVHEKDSLVKCWNARRDNFRKVSLEISLKYEIPEENLSIFLLSGSPERLVIDLCKCYERQSVYKVTPHMTLTRFETASESGYALINELKVNMAGEDIDLGIALANDNNVSRETTTSMQKRHKALAAINGGFFATSGGSLGLVYADNRLISLPVTTRPPRTAIAVTDDKKILMEKIVVKGNRLLTSEGMPLRKIKLALGGGPRLIASGEVHITADEEGLGKSGNDITRRAGRTAIAIDRQGQLSLYTITGFSESHHSGIKLEELAAMLKAKGAQEACCLDGGGSSAMSIQGDLVSSGAGAREGERKVANCLLVFDKEASLLPYSMEAQVPGRAIVADGKSTLDITVRVRNSKGEVVPDGTVVRFRSSAGSITPCGETKDGNISIKLRSIRLPGSVKVEAECGFPPQELCTIDFLPGPPRFCHTQVTPLIKLTESKKLVRSDIIEGCLVDALVLDEYLNPLPEEEMQFALYEGDTLKFSKGIKTDKKGTARIEVIELEKGMVMSVTCRNCEPQRLQL